MSRSEYSIIADQNIKEKDFWMNELEDASYLSHLIYDNFSANYNDFEYCKFSLTDLSSLLINRCSNSDNKLHVILLSNLFLLLKKYSGVNDLLIITPIYKTDIQNPINTILPVRCILNEESVKELFNKVGKKIFKAIENQNFPIPYLFDKKINFSTVKPYDIALELENIHGKDYLKNSNINITFSFVRNISDFACEIKYNKNLYRKETIELLFKHYTFLLSICLNDLDFNIDKIKLFTKYDEKICIPELKSVNIPEDSIISLFEKNADKNPNKIALVLGNNFITYKHLRSRADLFANYLINNGVSKGEKIGLLINNSVNCLECLLGILKIGGIYVIIDKEYSKKRKADLINNSSVSFLVLDRYNFNSNYDINPDIKLLDFSNQKTNGEISCFENINLDKNDLSAIYYTQGTTGEQKPFTYVHQHVTYLVEVFSDTIFSKLLNINLNIALFTSLAASRSQKLLFGSLIKGGCLHIITKNIKSDINSLFSFYNSRCIDITDLSPWVIRKDRISSFKKEIQFPKVVLLSGQKYDKDDILHIISKYVTSEIPFVYNIYEPTDGVGSSTIYKIVPSNKKIDVENIIGSPLGNSRFFVLNNRLEFLPVGVAGEIYILNNYSDKNETNNFILPDSSNLIKTGDIGRWRSDGNMEFIRKGDRKIKIDKSYIDIELLEEVLFNYNKSYEYIVVNNKQNELICYIIGIKPLATEDLKIYISGVLPKKYIPKDFIFLNELSKSGFIKYDRISLKEQECIDSIKLGPQNEIETKLVEAWSDILKLEKKDIGINQSFFELDGNSLNAIMLSSRIFREFSISVPLSIIFELPTIIQLSEYIMNSFKSTQKIVVPVEKKEYYDISYSQRSQYFLQNLKTDNTSYNSFAVLIFQGNFDFQRFSEAFDKLVQRHDILKTSFLIVDNSIFQKIEGNLKFRIEFVNSDETAIDYIIQSFVKPFDLFTPPLYCAKIAKVSDSKHYLLIDFHHIIVDGTSRRILLKELMNLYVGENIEAPLLQYKDYSQWQKVFFKTQTFNNQEAYWLNKLGGKLPILQLPADYNRLNEKKYEGAYIIDNIDLNCTEKLNEIAKEEGLSMSMLLFSIYHLMLTKLTGQEDIIIGTGINGRNKREFENITGMFINALAIRNNADKHKTLKEFINDVKNNIVDAFENLDYPFEMLVEKLTKERIIGRNPFFDVEFVMQIELDKNSSVPEVKIPGLEIRPYNQSSNNMMSNFDLMLMPEQVGNEISLLFWYNKQLFKESTIRKFCDCYIAIIDEIVIDMNTKIVDILESQKDMDRIELKMDFQL